MDAREQARHDGILLRLRQSLQALALPAPEQLLLFPDFVVKTDELVLDFDHWRDCAVGNYRAEFTEGQLDCLAALDSHIDSGSASTGRTVWDEESLASHPFWQMVRELSQSALRAFGWPLEVPPGRHPDYVRGNRA